MTYDITIGKIEKSRPLITCSSCTILRCECMRGVKQETNQRAPMVTNWNIQTHRKESRGFNYQAGLPIGYFHRWLDELGLDKAFTEAVPQNKGLPVVVTLDKMKTFMSLLQLAIEKIQQGKLTTKNTKDDLDFAKWFVWWVAYAVNHYSNRAGLELS